MQREREREREEICRRDGDCTEEKFQRERERGGAALEGKELIYQTTGFKEKKKKFLFGLYAVLKSTT
jgi:hypothetical protein